MKTEEILERVVSAAFEDFEIPFAERDEFKLTVAGMFGEMAMHSPVDTEERFRKVLAAYSDASRRAKCYSNVPVVDAACYATELCLAIDSAVRFHNLRVPRLYAIARQGGEDR